MATRDLADASSIEKQAVRMETAYAIIWAIHGDLSFDTVGTTIVENLVDTAGFSEAALSFAVTVGGKEVRRSYRSGGVEPATASRETPLFIRGQVVGALSVFVSSAEADEQFELLDYIMPTLTMSLDNALSFAEADDYRNTLEQRVIERTAELAEARDSLQRTVLDLEEAQAARSRIFANINHEIRTPLALVMLAANRIRSRYEHRPDRAVEESIVHIESACERLLTMVDSLLLLAAGQEGKLKLQTRTCDLAIETSRIVAIWQPLAKQHRIGLSYVGPQHRNALLDTAALERILANLISNAIKYTPDGGTVEVQVEATDGGSNIVIRDTGIGIDDEFRKRIFGRFEQGRPAVRQGARSSGIGLSIVKELAEAHGGSVAVDNNPGGGTVFSVFFPDLVIHEAPVSGIAHQIAPLGSLTASFGLTNVQVDTVRVLAPKGQVRATVLIAEDDPSLRGAVGEVLLNGGYRVLLAPDGFAALELADQYHPDMLVSDIGMPGMDGYELARRFRESKHNRIAPVLLLTAYGTTTDKLSGFSAGAVDYMVKPFEPRELLARVDSQLKIRDIALKLNESEKLAALGTMSAGLAHEIRNPANGLINALDPLYALLPEELTTLESGSGQLLDVIRDCAQQIGRLSKQLLGFTREGNLATSAESLPRLVSRAAGIASLDSRGAKFRTRLDFKDEFQCAAPLLLQVLVNLLDNAAQAAGPEGWIEVASQRRDDTLVLDIIDSGKGVPMELRERIFEPFFTTKGPGTGNGLGLSISRQIVGQHGGTLRVLDDTRSTFRIELPIHGASAGMPARPPQQTTSAP